MADGRVLEERVLHATGSPANPLTDAQVQEKFKALASDVLPGERAERALWDIDQVSDVTQLIPLLSA